MPTWNDFVAHPNYDEFWKKQASAPYLKRGHRADAERRRLVRPGGFLRPAQDLRAARRSTTRTTRTSSSSARGTTAAGQAGPGDKLGKIAFDSATGKYFRAKVQAPFFARYLKDKGEQARPKP